MTIIHNQTPVQSHVQSEDDRRALMERQTRDDWGLFNRIYDWDAIWPVVLQEVGNGASLTQAIKKPGYPTHDAFKKHMRANPSIRKQYDEALESRADHLAESVLEISDQAIPEDLDGPRLNAWINQMKIKIDTRKWTASKLRPKVWGDKIDVNVTHTQISITQALEQAEARLIENVTDLEVNDPKNDTE